MKSSKLNISFQTGGYVPTQLTDSAFIPTYVGTPLEDAKHYGTDLVNTYKQNIADLTKLDIANAQRKVNTADVAESAKYDQELKAQFEEMARKGDYENMTHQVNELARRHFNNKNIKLMGENFAEGEKAKAHAQALKDKGLAPLFYNDPDQHQTVNYDEKGNVQLAKYAYKGEAPLDWRKERQDVWDTVKANMGQMSQKDVAATLNAIDGYIATGVWKGISDKRVTGLLEHAIKTYEATPHYNQELRAVMAQNGGDEEAAKVELRSRMSSEGILHTFSETHPQYLDDWKEKLRMQKAYADQTALTDPETESLPGVSVSQALGFDLSKYNPDPNAPDNYKADANLSGAPGAPNTQSVAQALKTMSPEQQAKDIAETSAYREAVTDGMSIFGGDIDALVKQGTEGYNTPGAYKAAEQMTKLMKNRIAYPSIKPYTPEDQKKYTNTIISNLGSRLYWDMDNNEMIPTHEKGSQTVVNADLMDMMGGKEKNLVASGELNPKNPYFRVTKNAAFADAEVVQVTSKDGVVRNLLVSKPQSYYGSGIAQYKQIMNQVWSETALRPGGVKDAKIAGMDVKFSVKPMVDENGETGNGPFENSDTVTVYKIGDYDFSDNPLILTNGYDELTAKIIRALQQKNSKD